jgi:hypothetical protein
MKKQILLLTITSFFLIGLMMIPVQAQTITLSNPGATSERDMVVSFSNGTFYGLYNSTSIITLDGTKDYLFTMRPMSVSPLDDPTDWLITVAFPFVQSNVIALLVIMLMIGLLVSRR